MENIKKYHGFLGLPRHTKFLLNALGYDLFGFYVGLVMEAIWYRGSPNIGYVIKTQSEIALALGCSQSVVSRNLQKLTNNKYLVRHTQHQRICLAYFPLFLTDVAQKMHSKNYANLNEVYADMHHINADLQDIYVKTQEQRDQKRYQRLYSSSKENLGSFEEENTEIGRPFTERESL